MYIVGLSCRGESSAAANKDCFLLMLRILQTKYSFTIVAMPGDYQKKMGQWEVYYNIPQSFPIRWLNNFGDFSDFRLVGSFTLVLKRFNHWFLSTVKVILRIIIGNVHPFIGHCLIPLDSLETTTCSWLELWLPSLVKSLSADECIFYKFQWSDSA